MKGFDLSRINFFLVEEISITKNLEIILVKKVEEKTKKSGKKKKNTKRLDIEGINENNIHKKSAYQEEKDKDYEEFLEELEDEENHTENSKAQEKQKDENIDVFNEKKENNNEKAVNVENTEENKEVSNEKKEKTNEKAENNLKNEG